MNVISSTLAVQTSWQPSESGAQQICFLLAEFQKPGTNQSQILGQLEQCRTFPDFNNYLAFIFAQGDSLPLEVRQSAGLLLKNNFKEQYATTAEEYRQYIKLALLHAIGHPSKVLRHTVGTVVSTIVGLGGLESWPDLLVALVRCLESEDPNSLEGALDALYKICEDSPAQLERDVVGLLEKPSSVFIPRLLKLFKSPHADCKCIAIKTMNLLAGGMPAALAESIDLYLQGLFILARDPSGDVRRAVCSGLVQMLHLQPELMMPHMHDIIEYMLESTQDGDEGVALESCEFWAAFCEAQIEPAVLRPFLTRLVPVLLKNMVYGEHDEEVQDAEAAEADAGAEDREQDIAPFHHKSASHGVEEEGAGDGDEVNRWNLRKCSAAGVDVLSTVFGEEFLPIVLPIVQQRLQEADWRARESAILALGAISEGCAMGLVPYLADMIDMLLPKLVDSRPLVRSITCWGLSRYSHWIVERGLDPGTPGQVQLDTVMKGLLERVLDRNKHVQEAACSALATLEEEAGQELVPRMGGILQTLATAATQYGRKNMRLVYDALCTLADAVGRAMADPVHVTVFMPPLVARWNALPDTDRELLPLLECFTSIAIALGPAFEDFAAHTFERCMRIITMQMAARAAAAVGTPLPVESEKEFIVCSLDLISGMSEGLGASVEALVGASRLREFVLQCCADPSPDVRQSAFALVGDLAKVAAPHIAPALPQLTALAVASLDLVQIRNDTVSATNNACWALGELAVKARSEDLAPFATPIVERLVAILSSPQGALPRSIIENSAITLGRVGWICPDAIGPHLEHFMGVWCSSLRSVRDDVEKEHAFLGLCAMLRVNPQAALTSFPSLCEAITSWRTVRCEGLRNEMIQIMQLYKVKLAEMGQWDQFLAALSTPVRLKLVDMCKL